MRFFRHLGVRLFLLLVALNVGAFAVYVQLNYSVHRRHIHERTIDGARRLSEVILRSARHAMMDNNRARLGQIIASVGGQTQVEAVRIYAKSGEVVVSSDESEVGRVEDMSGVACNACHVGGSAREVVAPEELTRSFLSPDGHRVLGQISPIRNEPSCARAGCHVSPDEQRILGVLDLQLSLARDDSDLAASQAEMVRDAVFVGLVTTLGTMLFILVVVHVPVRKLRRGIERVTALDLDVDLGVRSQDEIGELAGKFEEMAVGLQRAQQENDRWAASLEEKVRLKTNELQRAQAHLIHSEKMASLGKLAAIVAHEINNPLASVFTYAKLLSRRVKGSESLAEGERLRLLEHLATIESETARCGETVKNMLLFAKRTPEGLRTEGLRDLIERSVRLVRHGMEMHDIELEIDLADLGEAGDQLRCNADQLQQMFVALLVNAVEAMPGGGRITLAAAARGAEEVEVSIGDTGVGIAETDRHRIFEPFFSTKAGEGSGGVGLGLAVVHSIVEAHGGIIDVVSAPGAGTTFRIVLPRQPRVPRANPEEVNAT